MSSTPDLIDLLARQATPIRRLRPPVQRAGIWVLVAAALLLLFTALHGVRPDLLERLRQPDFALGIAGGLLSGVLAAVASALTTRWSLVAGRWSASTLTSAAR